MFFQEHESCITPWYILHEINASAGSALHTTKPSPWLWTHGSTVMTRLSSHSPCVGDCILKTSDLRSQTWSCLQWWRCADLILGLSFSHGLLPESVSCACSLVSSYACHLWCTAIVGMVWQFPVLVHSTRSCWDRVVDDVDGGQRS